MSRSGYRDDDWDESGHPVYWGDSNAHPRRVLSRPASRFRHNNLASDERSIMRSKFDMEDMKRAKAAAAASGCDCKAGVTTTLRYGFQFFIAIILFTIETIYILPSLAPYLPKST
jgi:hypothetical protein